MQYEQHQMSLAAYLMGAEEYSYFGSGMHWDDPGWHVWWPEYVQQHADIYHTMHGALDAPVSPAVCLFVCLCSALS